ncbi:MAG: 2-polyprenyl-3-methyl-5-hydroxy-6-metoxy-1,4-benzoquinol methylase [Rhodococcus sp. (in: high G+C Gram-positive bacteria)]
MSLLLWLDKLNQRYPWSHNDFYGPWVVGKVAESNARTVLDIGCGTGNLVDLMRHRVDRVIGIEPDARCARHAAHRLAHDEAVTIEQRRFDQVNGNREADAVVLVAVLHHLPLTSTLARLRELTIPGGRIVIIGCYRQAGPVDAAFGLISVVANPILGFVKNRRRAGEAPSDESAPTREPRESLSEIVGEVQRILPGARIRRRLFWRYCLVYDVPK